MTYNPVPPATNPEIWAGEINGHDVRQHHSRQRRRTPLEVMRPVREERMNRRDHRTVFNCRRQLLCLGPMLDRPD
jgi:hypothetical protein